MRRIFVRIIVALLALLVGVLLTETFEDHDQDPQSSTLQIPPCPIASAVELSSFPEEVVEYPDERGLAPYEIESFIDDHPNADLRKLWKRLGIKATDHHYLRDFTQCQYCFRLKVLTIISMVMMTRRLYCCLLISVRRPRDTWSLKVTSTRTSGNS